jgi:hypothetical protein
MTLVSPALSKSLRKLTESLRRSVRINPGKGKEM